MREVATVDSQNDASVLDEAIRRSQNYFLRAQDDRGYWSGELESNVTMAAEYLLLTHFLGCTDAGRWRKISNYLRKQQRPDGSWAIWYGGPPDLNASVESYFALKMAGINANDPMMVRARNFILSVGGIPQVRIFTKIWLSLFGQWDWRGVPVLLPLNSFSFHLGSLSTSMNSLAGPAVPWCRCSSF